MNCDWFRTEQGNLMRTIISNTRRMTANTMESAIFILFLLLFAIASAGFVWQKGIADGNRAVHKLVVECLLIVASVVPPELPIQLSLAVGDVTYLAWPPPDSSAHCANLAVVSSCLVTRRLIQPSPSRTTVISCAAAPHSFLSGRCASAYP
jgi:hypothetical protein